MSKYAGKIVTNQAPAGYSVFFDGNADFLTTASNAAFAFGTGDYTIEAWIYPTSIRNGENLIYVTDVTQGTSFGYNQTQLYIGARATAFDLQVTYAVQANTWTHVAASRQSGTVRIFANGVLVGSGSVTRSCPQGPAGIGDYPSATGFGVTGYISNVRVLKGTALYTAAFTPPTQLLNVTNTSLLTCNSPAIVDQSSNAFAITTNGNAAVSTFTPFTAYVPYNPSLGASTPGVWTLDEAMQAAATRQWNMYDPYFQNTTLLLHGNGTNAAQNNTFLDSSSNNFTITRNGNTTQGSFSPFSQAPGYWSNYFDGTGDYLRFPDSSAGYQMGSGDFTVECWIFPTAATSLGRIFNNWNSTTAAAASWEILQVSTGIHFYCSTNGSTSQVSITSGTITVGVWSHIAAVRSGNVFTLYVNGISAGTTTQAITLQTANTCTIAARNSGGSYIENFAGYVSNARVVKGTAVYTGNFTLSNIPFTAVTNTQILTCQSNRFVDNSTNNYTLTIVGDTSTQPFSPFYPTAAYTPATIGGSGYFDGSGDYLGLTDSSNLLDIGGAVASIECWYYPTAQPAYGILISKGGGAASWSATNGFEYQLSYTSGTFTVYYNIGGGNSTFIANTTTSPLNQWYHVAVATDASNNLSLFVNGTRVATATNAITKPTTRTTVNIGNDVSGSYPSGYISGMRVIVGTGAYSASSTTLTIPTAPPTAITNTQLLTNFTNAGIVDSTAKNVLETVGNAQISTTQSKFGGSSMYFDGSGDYLLSPFSQNNRINTTGDFTIEFWAYFNSVASDQRLIGWDNNSSNFVIAIYTNTTGNLAYYLSSSGTSWNIAAGVSMGSIAINTWYHIALVRSGSVFTPYINGVAGTTTTSSSTLTSSTLPFSIGAVGNGSSPFNGYIDDFRITRGIARYTANFTPQTSQWQDQ